MVNPVKFVTYIFPLVQHTRSTRLWSIFILEVKVACVIHKLSHGDCHQDSVDSMTLGQGAPWLVSVVLAQHSVGCRWLSIEKQDLLTPTSASASTIPL